MHPILSSRAPRLAFSILAVASALRGDPVPYNHTDPRLVYDGARSDDFTVASAIDAAKWSISGPAASGLSADDPTNVALAGGALVFTGHTIDLASGTPVKGCYYTGGAIASKRRYGYGYYELCAQMPNVAGWTSAWTAASGASNSVTFTSFNSADNSTVAQACGYVSNYNRLNGYPASTYRYSTFTFDSGSSNVSPASPKTAFHYYGLEWTPRELIWYFDGVEIRRVAYPGPHSPIGLKVGLSARSVSGGSPTDGAQLQVRHLRYWTKSYDLAKRESSLVVAPTDLTPSYPASELAFNHQVFDWNETDSKYTTRPGDSAAAKPLASGDPANPIRQYYSTGDLARWSYNGTAQAADVFVWNPAMYAPSYLHADFGSPPASNPAQFSVVGDGITISATATIDQIGGGQRWVWLGMHAFTPGSGFVKLAAHSWAPELGIRAGAMQFRALDDFYDDFSGGLSGWTSSGGNWSVSSGVLAQNSTGATGTAFELRTNPTPWADGFVRGQLKFAGASPAINAGLIARYQSPGNYYLLRLVRPAMPGGAATLDLLRLVAGGATTLASVALDASIDPSAVFVDLHLFMVGTRFQGLVNGELVLEVVDSSGSAITAAGQAGVRTYGGTAQFERLGAGQ